MMPAQPIIIIGASARAAAFSALRAGLAPYCLDLFADEDLKARCPVQALDHATYPHCLLTELPKAPPGPWMYTGGLENYPKLIAQLARQRPLWGNDAPVLHKVRDPRWLHETLRCAGLPCPDVRLDPPPANATQQWLVKPLRGAGGSGIDWWQADRPATASAYWQRYVSGPAVSAVFCGLPDITFPCGVQRQLVGIPWLHARPFSYCGSILNTKFISEHLLYEIDAAGKAVASAADIRGLFGIDFIVHEGRAWTLEVNPRYTASVELIDYGDLGRQLMGWHRRAFSDDKTVPKIVPCGPVLGKAIYFARESLTVPKVGPWMPHLASLGPIERFPEFADIPAAGSRVQRGWPILTFFAHGKSDVEVETSLRRRAAELDALFGFSTGPM